MCKVIALLVSVHVLFVRVNPTQLVCRVGDTHTLSALAGN